MRKIKNFLSRLRPKSEQELMMEYLSEAKDIVHLEYMMKQWDDKHTQLRRHW